MAERPQLSFLHDQLEQLKAEGRYFRLRVLDGEQKAVATFDGKQVINLGSNNYLGLTSHRALKRAAIDAVRRYGAGAGAVRTIAGTMRPHLELEEQIARFKNTEACVVFQSGFTANAGTVAAILGKDDLILSDELNHASIIDGCRLSRATIKVFQHRDVADCRRRCEETARSVRAGRRVWLHHDGGRRARLGRPGPRRARHRGPFGLPRPRGHPGGHSQQGCWRDGRIRLRAARFD
jgi:glycine C-acetyltransferase